MIDAAATDDLFAVLPEFDDVAQRRLRARLATAADQADLLDVAYRTIDSPVGRLLLAATPAGLVKIAFSREDPDQVLQQLATRISPRVLRAPGRLDPAAREIDEYLDGRRTAFDLPLDFQLATGFRRTVLAQLPNIAYGRTSSYAAVALAAGHPKAVRAVGTACATNPLPLVVPCHRVIRSDGVIGQYAGGTEAKQLLLNLESAGVEGCVD